MNIEIKTNMTHTITDENLYKYVQSLATAQANGVIAMGKTKPGTLYYPEVSDHSITIAMYKAYVSDAIVEMRDYSLFIYAPIAFLESNVFAGLPGATTLILNEDTNEFDVTPVKWKNWKSSDSYTQPIHTNDTHVIIGCQYSGNKLTETQASIIITNEVSSEIELMGAAELAVKVTAHF
jgi:hypothetical protein|tara:strand:+ start:39 stop:575 length:537 start_codon:yes stop_codon:yes gene_type:complete